MKVLFIGGTLRGYLTLKALIDSGLEMAGVISLRQDDHEVERWEEPIRLLAESCAIPHRLTKWMKDYDYAAWIRELGADIAFVVGCRILIPREIYEAPTLGTLAVHDSLLPEYRGFAPLNWSIVNGASETGVTLFYLDEGMDTGDIVAQKAVPIGSSDSAPEVYERVCSATVDVILENCPALAAGTAPRIRQDPRAGSLTCSRTPRDGEIDWNRPTREIFNLVRALAYPYPGAFTYHEYRRLIVRRAAPVEDAPTYVGRIPGRIVAVSKDTGAVDILTADGILRVFETQYPGEAPAPAASVLRSVRAALGISVADLLARLETAERALTQFTELVK